MLKYFLTAIIFILLDGIYLYLVKGYFNQQVKKIQDSPIQINIIYVAITYVFLIFGLIYFIIQKHKSVKEAAIFGLVVYGVFEFTSISLFKNWSFLTVLLDTTWGTVLCALTTGLVYKIISIV